MKPKPITSGRLIREIEAEETLYLVSDGREIGRITVVNPSGTKIKLCLEIDRAIRIERREP